MISKLVVAVLALCVATANAAATNAPAGPAAIMIEFDNRGSKIMDDRVNYKIIQVLAKNVFKVGPEAVFQVSGEGRSNLVNHKSTVTYAAMGKSSNGKSLYDNCVAASKSGWFSSSTVKKEIKAATDGWLPGDSATVKSATCSQFKSLAAAKNGRKMML